MPRPAFPTPLHQPLFGWWKFLEPSPDTSATWTFEDQYIPPRSARPGYTPVISRPFCDHWVRDRIASLFSKKGGFLENKWKS